MSGWSALMRSHCCIIGVCSGVVFKTPELYRPAGGGLHVLLQRLGRLLFEDVDRLQEDVGRKRLGAAQPKCEERRRDMQASAQRVAPAGGFRGPGEDPTANPFIAGPVSYTHLTLPTSDLV